MKRTEAGVAAPPESLPGPARLGRRLLAVAAVVAALVFFVVTSGVNFVTAIVVGAPLALGRTLPHQGAVRSSQDAGRLRRLAARSGGALGDGLRDAGELLKAGRPALVLGAVGYMALDAAAL